MRKYLIFLLTLLLVACSGAGSLEAVDKNNTEEINYTIKSGSNLTIVANELEDLDIISDASSMIKYAKDNDLTNIKAGEYILSKSMTPIEILHKFHSGDVYKGTKIVVQEGLEAVQIAEKIEKAGLGSAEKFMYFVNNPSEFKTKYEFLNDDRIISLEGYLYPLTYHFKESDTEKDIIDKMLNSFNKVYYSDIVDNLSNTGKTLNEIIILASIVEREAALESEMPLVASVFQNRLDINMKLESCATVQYILKERKWILSNEEISIDSPYNTYKYGGLPITPIASPSLKAILAAMNPAESNYLFFLAKNDGTGEQVFSTTYAEHMQNRKKYLE